MASIPGVRFDITGASGSQGLLGPKGSWRCYVLPRGANAAADGTASPIVFDSVSEAARFSANKWIQVGTDTDNIRKVSSVGGNSIAYAGSNVTVSENDRVFVIGSTQPTVTGGSATYRNPDTVIYERDNTSSDRVSNSMVTSDSNGLIQFWTGDTPHGVTYFDCIIQDGDQSNQGYLVDLAVGHGDAVGKFNVLDYGAVGDGTTDDSTAIQAAITAAQGVSGTVAIPTGVYLVGSSMNVTASCNIEGEGWGSVLKCNGAHMVLYIKGSSIGVTLRDFAVDGNGNGQLNAGLIDFDDEVNFLIERLYIHDAGDGTDDPSGVNGIAFGSATGQASGTVRDCLFEYCDKAPLNWSGAAESFIHVSGCVSRYNSGNGSCPGFQFNGAGRATIVGNIAYNNEGYGIALSPVPGGNSSTTEYSVVANNVCHSNCVGDAGAGITVNRASTELDNNPVIIANNHCYNNGTGANQGDGIELLNVDNIIITGNNCHTNGVHGITIEGTSAHGSYITVKGNHCRGNNQQKLSNVAGINIRDYRNVLVEGNYCYDDQATKTQGYGLFFDDPGSDQINVFHNVLTGNSTGSLSYDSYPTNSVMAGNIEGTGEEWRMTTDSDPQIELSEGNHATAATRLIDASSAIGRLRKQSGNESPFIEIDTFAGDGTSDEYVDIFKNSVTTGLQYLRQRKGIWSMAAEADIVAGVTQTQGTIPLTATINSVGTVGTTGDVVTLPPAAAGNYCVVINSGAQTLGVFPASGDALNGGAGVSTTIANTQILECFAISAVSWSCIAHTKV